MLQVLKVTACLALAFAAANAAVPKITFANLQKVSNSKHLLHSLRDDGGRISAFAVTGLPASDYRSKLEGLRSKSEVCIGEDESLPIMELSGGSTRRTYATEDDEYPKCIRSEAETVARTFDAVGMAVSRAIEAVSGGELFFAQPMGLKQRLESAPHKDHIHFYKSLSSHQMPKSDHLLPPMVPEHTDNGLFLLITPFAEQSLVIKTSSGARVSTSDLDPADSVLVLSGVALSEWLLQTEDPARSKFFPVPHSVPHVGTSTSRTVFARMAVAPGNAIPISLGKSETRDLVTFNEVFVRKSNAYPISSDSKMCTVDLNAERYTRQADDQCAGAPNTAYCWHDCLDIPSNCTDDIIGDGGMLCMDMMEYEKCDPDIHNPNCMLFCPFVVPEPEPEGGA
jgi:hypothetical protein